MKKYINIRTGEVIIVESDISGGPWRLVDKKPDVEKGTKRPVVKKPVSKKGRGQK